jgi:hypothetical protein
MHDQPKGGGERRPMSADEEFTREERAVLYEVLGYYPAHLRSRS